MKNRYRSARRASLSSSGLDILQLSKRWLIFRTCKLIPVLFFALSVGIIVYLHYSTWHAVVVSLSSGLPVVIRESAGHGGSYPSVLARDVSGRLPDSLQHEVASRLAQTRQSGGPLKLLSVPSRRPSCNALISGNLKEIKYSLKYMETYKPIYDNSYAEIIKAPDDCEGFLRSRGYINYSSSEELEFPIAYSMMMYRDADQAERLLRAIYRPQNHYCIHVDAKSDESIQKAMRALTKCLPNVFMASKQNKVDWAMFNSLTPWIYCMQDLWKFKLWKYFINLTGQEFPLKTNWQIVKILKALNGSNVVDTTTYPDYAERWYDNFPAPFNIQPYKGLVFVMASRGFVDYILHQQVAKDFLEWISHTKYPDESFFSSLNHNVHLKVPGSYKGNPETDALTKPFIGRFVNWGVQWKDGQGRLPFSWPCGGKRVRNVCIFGVKDLPLLVNRKELFANKFIPSFEPLALDCVEEWHFNMTLAEYAGLVGFDTSWYSNLDIVKNKVL